jgi:hypothetical protein
MAKVANSLSEAHGASCVGLVTTWQVSPRFFTHS